MGMTMNAFFLVSYAVPTTGCVCLTLTWPASNAYLLHSGVSIFARSSGHTDFVLKIAVGVRYGQIGKDVPDTVTWTGLDRVVCAIVCCVLSLVLFS